MKKVILLAFVLLETIVFSQEKKVGTIQYNYVVDSIFSTNIEDYRTIKVFLPDDYSKDEKYPTIYTLDGEWMFNPVVSESKVLMDFDVVPKSIVIGIFHKDRNEDLGIDWDKGKFNEGSTNFFNFLKDELIPRINSNYATSGFNVLIGHSNSATFSHEVLVQKKQPFNGIVALSQNLFGNQLEEYVELARETFNTPLFYFVASGKRDATSRLESGIKLDSVFNLEKNKYLKTKHAIYDAEHNGLVARALNDGISHVFSEYRHYNDFENKLIDSLVANNIRSFDFMSQHAKKMKDFYGIDFKVNQTDLFFMYAFVQNSNDIEELKRFEIENFGKGDEFYSLYAQIYESVKNYERALEYWNIHLENNNKNISNFFYYRRPIDLLYNLMDQPQRAIKFAQKWKLKAPKYAQSFNVKIAKIALHSKTEKEAGLSAVREYIEYYTGRNEERVEKARKIEKQLEQ